MRCYLVTAEALHLRASANEHARVVGYLYAGMIVIFDGLAVDGWMHVHYGPPQAGADNRLAGWVNASYLEESECE